MGEEMTFPDSPEGRDALMRELPSMVNSHGRSWGLRSWFSVGLHDMAKPATFYSVSVEAIRRPLGAIEIRAVFPDGETRLIGIGAK